MKRDRDISVGTMNLGEIVVSGGAAGIVLEYVGKLSCGLVLPSGTHQHRAQSNPRPLVIAFKSEGSLEVGLGILRLSEPELRESQLIPGMLIVSILGRYFF